MLNFNKYRKEIPYPLEMDFIEIEILVSKTGKEIKNKIFHREDYDKALLNAIKERNRIDQEFKKDLFEDLEITNNPKAELLFEKSWDFGHANGYREVYSYAEDLVDLIR